MRKKDCILKTQNINILCTGIKDDFYNQGQKTKRNQTKQTQQMLCPLFSAASLEKVPAILENVDTFLAALVSSLMGQ